MSDELDEEYRYQAWRRWAPDVTDAEISALDGLYDREGKAVNRYGPAGLLAAYRLGIAAGHTPDDTAPPCPCGHRWIWHIDPGGCTSGACRCLASSAADLPAAAPVPVDDDRVRLVADTIIELAQRVDLTRGAMNPRPVTPHDAAREILARLDAAPAAAPARPEAPCQGSCGGCGAAEDQPCTADCRCVRDGVHDLNGDVPASAPPTP